MTMAGSMKDRTVELEKRQRRISHSQSQQCTEVITYCTENHFRFLEKKEVELYLEFWTIKRLLSEGERTPKNTAGGEGPHRGMDSNKSFW